MTHPARPARLALFACAALAASANAVAHAQGTYVYEWELATDYVGNRFTGNGLSLANDALRERFAKARATVEEAVERHGGRVLAASEYAYGIGQDDRVEATLTGWAVRDGEHVLYRRRGKLTVLFASEQPLPRAGRLADARAVEPGGTVKVWVVAHDRERGRGLARRQKVTLSLSELELLVRRPSVARRTGFGALLRRAWQVALGGAEDDRELVAARLTVDFGGLRLAGGDVLLSVEAEQTLPEETADLALGRRRSFRDKWRAFLGREEELPAADEATLDLLDAALDEARGAEERRRVLALRQRPAGALGKAELDVLRAVASGVRRRHRGATGVLSSELGPGTKPFVPHGSARPRR